MLRAAVSGQRHRWRGEVDGTHYDLDLSYITSRIIVMGFPSTGLESSYRNPIAAVADFLNAKHSGSYMVFNVAERKFDPLPFDFQVMDLGFDDKQTAPLDVTLTLCKAIDGWLASDADHVACINCTAGKGRSGVIAAAYLLYSGVYFTAEGRAEAEELLRDVKARLPTMRDVRYRSMFLPETPTQQQQQRRAETALPSSASSAPAATVDTASGVVSAVAQATALTTGAAASPDTPSSSSTAAIADSSSQAPSLPPVDFQSPPATGTPDYVRAEDDDLESEDDEDDVKLAGWFRGAASPLQVEVGGRSTAAPPQLQLTASPVASSPLGTTAALALSPQVEVGGGEWVFSEGGGHHQRLPTAWVTASRDTTISSTDPNCFSWEHLSNLAIAHFVGRRGEGVALPSQRRSIRYIARIVAEAAELVSARGCKYDRESDDVRVGSLTDWRAGDAMLKLVPREGETADSKLKLAEGDGTTADSSKLKLVPQEGTVVAPPASSASRASPSEAAPQVEVASGIVPAEVDSITQQQLQLESEDVPTLAADPTGAADQLQVDVPAPSASTDSTDASVTRQFQLGGGSPFEAISLVENYFPSAAPSTIAPTSTSSGAAPSATGSHNSDEPNAEIISVADGSDETTTNTSFASAGASHSRHASDVLVDTQVEVAGPSRHASDVFVDARGSTHSPDVEVGGGAHHAVQVEVGAATVGGDDAITSARTVIDHSAPLTSTSGGEGGAKGDEDTTPQGSSTAPTTTSDEVSPQSHPPAATDDTHAQVEIPPFSSALDTSSASSDTAAPLVEVAHHASSGCGSQVEGVDSPSSSSTTDPKLKLVPFSGSSDGGSSDGGGSSSGAEQCQIQTTSHSSSDGGSADSSLTVSADSSAYPSDADGGGRTAPHHRLCSSLTVVLTSLQVEGGPTQVEIGTPPAGVAAAAAAPVSRVEVDPPLSRTAAVSPQVEVVRSLSHAVVSLMRDLPLPTPHVINVYNVILHGVPTVSGGAGIGTSGCCPTLEIRMLSPNSTDQQRSSSGGGKDGTPPQQQQMVFDSSFTRASSRANSITSTPIAAARVSLGSIGSSSVGGAGALASPSSSSAAAPPPRRRHTFVPSDDIIAFTLGVPLAGDVMVRCLHTPSGATSTSTSTELFRFTFHTSFMRLREGRDTSVGNGVYRLTPAELDFNSRSRPSTLPNGFAVDVVYGVNRPSTSTSDGVYGVNRALVVDAQSTSSNGNAVDELAASTSTVFAPSSSTLTSDHPSDTTEISERTVPAASSAPLLLDASSVPDDVGPASVHAAASSSAAVSLPSVLLDASSPTPTSSSSSTDDEGEEGGAIAPLSTTRTVTSTTAAWTSDANTPTTSTWDANSPTHYIMHPTSPRVVPSLSAAAGSSSDSTTLSGSENMAFPHSSGSDEAAADTAAAATGSPVGGPAISIGDASEGSMMATASSAWRQTSTSTPPAPGGQLQLASLPGVARRGGADSVTGEGISSAAVAAAAAAAVVGHSDRKGDASMNEVEVGPPTSSTQVEVAHPAEDAFVTFDSARAPAQWFDLLDMQEGEGSIGTEVEVSAQVEVAGWEGVFGDQPDHHLSHDASGPLVTAEAAAAEIELGREYAGSIAEATLAAAKAAAAAAAGGDGSEYSDMLDGLFDASGDAFLPTVEVLPASADADKHCDHTAAAKVEVSPSSSSGHATSTSGDALTVTERHVLASQFFNDGFSV